jgi:DNA-directed RNA polymerase subunit N (RpoN/RPB10)
MSLSPILYLFLSPSGKLYQKLQYLLAEDEKAQRITPPILQHRRPGPRNPAYGIPASEWPTMLKRVLEKKEPLRKVADDYGVSHETIRRMARATYKLQAE